MYLTGACQHRHLTNVFCVGQVGPHQPRYQFVNQSTLQILPKWVMDSLGDHLALNVVANMERNGILCLMHA